MSFDWLWKILGFEFKNSPVGQPPPTTKCVTCGKVVGEKEACCYIPINQRKKKKQSETNA